MNKKLPFIFISIDKDSRSQSGGGHLLCWNRVPNINPTLGSHVILWIHVWLACSSGFLNMAYVKVLPAMLIRTNSVKLWSESCFIGKMWNWSCESHCSFVTIVINRHRYRITTMRNGEWAASLIGDPPWEKSSGNAHPHFRETFHGSIFSECPRFQIDRDALWFPFHCRTKEQPARFRYQDVRDDRLRIRMRAAFEWQAMSGLCALWFWMLPEKS